MYEIIYKNRSCSNYLHYFNFFEKDNDKIGIETYFLIYNYRICGVFSYNYNEYINILLFKINLNIPYKYLNDFIYNMFNIINEFEDVYIDKNNITPLDIILKQFTNYDIINEKYLKKRHKYNYLNCLII